MAACMCNLFGTLPHFSSCKLCVQSPTLLCPSYFQTAYAALRSEAWRQTLTQLGRIFGLNYLRQSPVKCDSAGSPNDSAAAAPDTGSSSVCGEIFFNWGRPVGGEWKFLLLGGGWLEFCESLRLKLKA